MYFEFTVLFQDAGDFAGVAYFVLKNRCPERGTLKISEVNTALDNIAQYNAEKNKEQVLSFWYCKFSVILDTF